MYFNRKRNYLNTINDINDVLNSYNPIIKKKKNCYNPSIILKSNAMRCELVNDKI